jgi:hypothetical protein
MLITPVDSTSTSDPVDFSEKIMSRKNVHSERVTEHTLDRF